MQIQHALNASSSQFQFILKYISRVARTHVCAAATCATFLFLLHRSEVEMLLLSSGIFNRHVTLQLSAAVSVLLSQQFHTVKNRECREWKSSNNSSHLPLDVRRKLCGFSREKRYLYSVVNNDVQ